LDHAAFESRGQNDSGPDESKFIARTRREILTAPHCHNAGGDTGFCAEFLSQTACPFSNLGIKRAHRFTFRNNEAHVDRYKKEDALASLT
jgi:hypothetical protein